MLPERYLEVGRSTNIHWLVNTAPTEIRRVSQPLTEAEARSCSTQSILYLRIAGKVAYGTVAHLTVSQLSRIRIRLL